MLQDIFSTEPSPNFDNLVAMIRGERQLDRVYFGELGIDPEIMKQIWEEFFKQTWYTDPISMLHQRIIFYYRMGYDFLRYAHAFVNPPIFPTATAQDTALLSRGFRNWLDEDQALIHNWDDFKKINWADIVFDYKAMEFYKQNLPSGMKVLLSYPMFEIVIENFFGYQGLCLNIIQQSDLVAEVFQAWGQKIYDFYQTFIDEPIVGGIFHSDDLGYKTATIISPQHLRKYVLPWFKKYADLAKQHGKIFALHCCGNIGLILLDLISDVKIDILHSFQDQIMPVTEFKVRYPNVGAMGGIDIDKLARLGGDKLRDYIRHTLQICQAQGRYILGSGNSVTNYIPIENYLIMLEEGKNWKPA